MLKSNINLVRSSNDKAGWALVWVFPLSDFVSSVPIIGGYFTAVSIARTLQHLKKANTCYFYVLLIEILSLCRFFKTMNILFLCWEIVVWSEYFFFILLENQEFISQDNKNSEYWYSFLRLWWKYSFPLPIIWLI